jgi:transcriptional regulator with XRE-family HTH domain
MVPIIAGVITKEDVALTLKRLRGSRTQALCAREAEINANAWSHYERAERMPTAETFAKIAQGLGVTIPELEEELLESRHQRLRGEEKARSAQAAAPSPAEDPFRRAVHEGVQNITRELEKLILLVGDARNLRL